MGTLPGDTYPVFATDFGRLGFMICYDTHYPEVSRILALHGADLILNPNMGDGREGGILWETVIRTRAIDNQVHVAAAVNGGRSCVISPKGEVLSMTDRTNGSIAYAECELDASVCDHTGRPIRKRYERVRRADTYATLVRDVFLSGRAPEA